MSQPRSCQGGGLQEEENRAGPGQVRQTPPKISRARLFTYTQGLTNQIVQAESEYEMSFTTKVREVETEFQPLHKLFRALEFNTHASTKVNSEMVYLEEKTKRHWQQNEKTNKQDHKLTMLLDCGSPSTIVGVENFKQIKEQYTSMIQSNFKYSQSNKHYEFG